MITIFGRKKKEEKHDENKPDPSNPTPAQTVTVPGEAVSEKAGGFRDPSDEDTSLSGLLKSLISEIPTSEAGQEYRSFNPPATPDFVPPRATPHSRPMLVVSGDKGKKLVEAEQATEAGQLVEDDSEYTSDEDVGDVGGEDSGFGEVDNLAEEVQRLEAQVKKHLEEPARVERPPKPERQERQEKQQTAEKERPPQSKRDNFFDRVFEVADSAFQSPGLILVDGPDGSGKTAFCLSVAAGYLQKGSPCILVTYDQSPGDARERMKKIGCDPSVFESQFRLLLVDGFSGQSESFSMEPYYVERPQDLGSLKDTIIQNTQVFMGEKTPVLLDSLDTIIAKSPAKELSKGLRELVDSLKATGTTFLVTVDSEKLSKEAAGMLEGISDCIIDLSKTGAKDGKLLVRKLQGASGEPVAQAFEFDPANRIVLS